MIGMMVTAYFLIAASTSSASDLHSGQIGISGYQTGISSNCLSEVTANILDGIRNECRGIIEGRNEHDQSYGVHRFPSHRC